MGKASRKKWQNRAIHKAAKEISQGKSTQEAWQEAILETDHERTLRLAKRILRKGTADRSEQIEAANVIFEAI